MNFDNNAKKFNLYMCLYIYFTEDIHKYFFIIIIIKNKSDFYWFLFMVEQFNYIKYKNIYVIHAWRKDIFFYQLKHCIVYKCMFE